MAILEWKWGKCIHLVAKLICCLYSVLVLDSKHKHQGRIQKVARQPVVPVGHYFWRPGAKLKNVAQPSPPPIWHPWRFFFSGAPACARMVSLSSCWMIYFFSFCSSFPPPYLVLSFPHFFSLSPFPFSSFWGPFSDPRGSRPKRAPHMPLSISTQYTNQVFNSKWLCWEESVSSIDVL